MQRAILMWAGAMVLLLFGPLEVMAQNGQMRGRVLSEAGGPVAGAQITVMGTNRGGMTDARGLYVISNIPAGTHTVRVEMIGHARIETTLTISASETTSHNFRLTREVLALEQVSVTVGSRARVTAGEELTVPVDVFTRADIVESVPQMEMAMVLAELSPAIYFPRAQIADISSGVRPFQLRGLSPDHSLVLVNGKRRHPTSVVHVFGAASGGSGSSGVDMNTLIPASMAGMEILRDGAAAAYGSDAIAGVINVQLRDDIHKPELTVSMGQYTPSSDAFKRDGTRIEVGGSSGFSLSDRGTLVLSGVFSDRQQTDRAGPDPRDQIVPGDADEIEIGADGIGRIVQKNNAVPQPNHLIGDGETTNVGGFFNARYLVGEDRVQEAYGFGGYTFRRDLSAGFFRRGLDARNWPEIHPLGFLPKFRGDNSDLMLVSGLRGPMGSWTYDASLQLNRNVLSTDIFDTHNVSLGPCLETACAPDADVPNKTDVYAGATTLNQYIASFDLNREFEAGLHSPLNVAIGAAVRRDNYQIEAGETASWINGGHPDRDGNIAAVGSQVFTGFRPDQEVNESRNNIGIYTDLEADLTPAFRLAGAARFENYSDFGSTVTGKVATRLKLADEFIVRGAVSTGFRAPNMAQSYYSHVSTGFRTDPDDPNNQVAYEIGEIPVGSPIARALGAEELTEEKTVNLSAGFAFTPLENLTFTVDVYQVDIDDRIILTGSLSGPTVEELLQDINAPTVKFYTNSVDTRTRGFDVSGRYRHVLEGRGYLEFLGQYNHNKLSIEAVNVPNVIAELEDQIFGSGTQYAMESGRPKDRATARARFVQERYRVGLGANHYGLQAFSLSDAGAAPAVCSDPNRSSDLRCLGDGTTFLDNGPHLVFDADLSFTVRSGLQLTIGAENLLNSEPPVRPDGFNFSGNFPYYSTSGLHMNGRYIYTNLRVSF